MRRRFRDGSVELCTVTRIHHCEVLEDRICNSLHPWHSPRVSSSGKGTTFLLHVIHAMVFVTCCTATILPVIDAVLVVGSTSANGTWNGSTS